MARPKPDQAARTREAAFFVPRAAARRINMMVMTMSKLLAPGVVAGLCTAAASIATAYGAVDVAAAFNDPKTPTLILAAIGVVGSLVAGFLPAHRTPAPPAA